MKKNRLLQILLFCVLFGWTTAPAISSPDDIFTPISKIIENPKNFQSEFVSVKGRYFGWHNAPGRPPVTRSDWVIGDEHNNTIYCTGLLPQNLNPSSSKSMRTPITVLAKVEISDNKKPYLVVQEIRVIKTKIEKMVSVSQILFSIVSMKGKYVGLLGVLVKGHEANGGRVCLLADPTGAIKLGPLPKLYPKGTILHVRGTIDSDKNGLPILKNVEIVSAKVDLENFKIPEKYLH